VHCCHYRTLSCSYPCTAVTIVRYLVHIRALLSLSYVILFISLHWCHYRTLSCSYPCTGVSIVRYLVHIRALLSLSYGKTRLMHYIYIYINTVLFALLHSYLFQASKANLRGYWYTEWTGSTKYMSRWKYQIKHLLWQFYSRQLSLQVLNLMVLPEDDHLCAPTCKRVAV